MVPSLVKKLPAQHDDALTPREKKIVAQSYENEKNGLTMTETELRKKLGL